MFVVLAPSRRVLFELRLAPLTLNCRAREGFVGMECAFSGGENPGRARKIC